MVNSSDSQQTKGEVRMCFMKKWNIIYMVKFYQNQKTLYLAHIIQFILALITSTILYSAVNTNFQYAIYLSPLCLIYSFIQIMVIKKSLTNPKYHWIFQLVCFFIFLPIFVALYLYIYNPTFNQSFVEGTGCKIIKDSRAILKDGSYLENFQVLTVEFNFNGQLYQGCGCGSNKNQESIFQTRIEPFRYVTNDEMEALNFNTSQITEDISTIKMPSWMCQPFQDYSSDLKNTNTNKVDVDTCYYNFYGMTDLDLVSQASSEYCKKSDSFVQVIFDEKPYFPVDQFCLLIAFTMMPFFSFSLNMVIVIVLHFSLPCLRVDVERGFFDVNMPYGGAFVKPNKIIPTNTKQKEQSKVKQSRVSEIPPASKKQLDENLEIGNKSNNKNNNISSVKQLSSSYIKSPKSPNSSDKGTEGKASLQQQSQTQGNNPNDNSVIAENNNLLYREPIKLNSTSNMNISQENERDTKNTDSQMTRQNYTHNTPKNYENFFSLPSLKKKVLPPIQMNINYSTILKENTKKEIEEDKLRRQEDNSPTIKYPKKVKAQSSFEVPALVINNQPSIHSILHNKDKKILNSSLSSKKRFKVQFARNNTKNNNSERGEEEYNQSNQIENSHFSNHNEADL